MEEDSTWKFSFKSYLLSLSKYISASAMLLIVSIYMGLASQRILTPMFQPILNPIREYAKLFKGLSDVELFIVIFANNSVKGLMNILLGVFLGLYPLIFIALNGFVIGFTAGFASSAKGLNLVLAGILPHGIFEIPAILICSSMGFKIAVEAVKSLLGLGKLKLEIKKALKTYVYIVLPLLLVAALIEAFVTPKIIALLTH